MEKILNLRLHKNGVFTQLDEEDGDLLALELEERATTIRIVLPSELYGFEHRLVVERPDGTILRSSEIAETTEEDADANHVLLIPVGLPLTGQCGRIKVQYIGEFSNKTVRSKMLYLDIEQSITGEDTASLWNVDFQNWLARKFQEFRNLCQTNLTAAEEYARQQIAAITEIDGDTIDTLKEIADWINHDDGAIAKLSGLRRDLDEIIQISNEKVKDKKFLSLEREGEFLYKVTFDSIPEYEDISADTPAGGCTSFVKDGKLFRMYDWEFNNAAQFKVFTKHFKGMAYIVGLNEGSLPYKKVSQLPYHMVDGVNDKGIKVSVHVLYNDFGYEGSGEETYSITSVPFHILDKATSMANLRTQLTSVFANIKVPQQLKDMGYLLQFLVTDGTTTIVIAPPTSASGNWEFIDASENPKLTNFRYLNKSIITKDDNDLQLRPTGIERWNLISEHTLLSDLRFTLAYQSNARLTEFIGLRETSKLSEISELQEIYETAHDMYAERTRNGQTWHTVHAVVYSGCEIEHLFVQEDFFKDYAQFGEVNTKIEDLDARKQEKLNSDSVISVSKVTAKTIDAGFEYVSEAPTENNPNGIKFAILDEEPEEYKDGYFYIIKGE